MRRVLGCALMVLSAISIHAQKPKVKSNKYPSLLWEITGNGLKKPSYLFGTMHVSSKMVFHLSDSFYTAIRNADVVALETNPDSWQEDMYQFNLGSSSTDNPFFRPEGSQSPDDYLSINTLKFNRYERLIQTALVSNPSTINNLLYRTYSDKESDFEEDTYLDLYIYQLGKKWRKKVMGVERYEESMRLMLEAYVDAMAGKKRERNYEVEDGLSYAHLQDAYRTGNLDLLDTINKVNSFSAAFDEKFLFKRNDIQAASIDSIMRSKSSLFVGVGAAHLPGERGVIEILRRKGYKLRPIRMGERDSRQKEEVENIAVPTVFSKQVSDDGFFKVDVPGKLYHFSGHYNGFYQQQYADMANGSYYIVTRVHTNAQLFGDDADAVFKKIDSLLYENIPGKIISKQAISRNGYKGFAIVNKTRRGDYQRYNIFVTPFEIIFFKISGNGDYLKSNTIADKFFNSIELKEYASSWARYTPDHGGFEVSMPHQPYVIKNNGNWQYTAFEKSTATDYEVIRTDVHNHAFAEEDSFDLGLMEESFTSSDFYSSTVSRKQTSFKGYPSLEAKYLHKDGSVSTVRYLIQGPHYYTVVAHSKKEHAKMAGFLNSFSIQPFIYKEQQKQTDTSLFYTVTTPFYPRKKSSLELPGGIENVYLKIAERENGPAAENGFYKEKIITNDSTGERVYVSVYKAPKYKYVKDSAEFETPERYVSGSSWVVRSKTKTTFAGGMRVWEYALGDTNSSRMLQCKDFYKNGVGFSIRTLTDTLTAPGAFIKNFFSSFTPADTVTGVDPFVKKGPAFFADFFSADTTLHKKALVSISQFDAEAEDFNQLKRAMESLSWKEPKYMQAKKDFMDKLGTINSKPATDYLKTAYYAAGDTVELQYVVLQSLLAQKTKYSFHAFKDIMINEPPVLDISASYAEDDEEYADSFMDGLYDSLQLTSGIFNELLPLINIDDYKQPMLELMGTLMDSNLLAAKDYAIYQQKFLLEAKQAWKKQLVAEKNKSINRAQNANKEGADASFETTDYGNTNLSVYATLLMPWWNSNPAVPQLLQQMLNSNDKVLKYATALLFIRNGRKVPDTILQSIAADDNLRYELYLDLSRMDKLSFFPSAYNNQMELAKSKLLGSGDYQKPDSLVFLKKLPVQWKDKKGSVYFFKYKRKKDDAHWKLASVGLVPDDEKKIAFGEGKMMGAYERDLDFTDLSDRKLNDDESLEAQLQKALKQLLYSKHKSAKEFYSNDREMDLLSSSLGY